MYRSLCAFVLVGVLPSCVAAIGNTGRFGTMPEQSVPHLHEKVNAAERIVGIRERALASVRTLFESGRAGADQLAAAEVQVEEARIQLAQFRAELAAAQQTKSRD